jgi:hypothetical protein
MTLFLNGGTRPDNLMVAVDYFNRVVIGNHRIPMKDFMTAVGYILTTTDLEPNDSRLSLVKDIRKMRMVPGVNKPGSTRLAFSHVSLLRAKGRWTVEFQPAEKLYSKNLRRVLIKRPRG